MPAVSQRPGRLDLDVVRGDDAEVVLTFVDADGDPVNLSGRTWQLRLGGAISVNLDDVVDDSDAVTGVISFPLADTTTQLVTDRTTWYLRDDTNDRTLLDGQVRAATPGQAGGVGSTSQTVTITNGTAEVTVTAAVVGPSGTAAVTVHNLLTGRDAEDAHPISAITGLQAALDAAGGGGSVAVANVSSVISFDLDGVFTPDDPVAFPPGFILAVVNQNVNPEWDGIYEGQADPSPAPMVRVGDLPDTLMWSSYRVTQPSEVVAPLPGGLWAEDDGMWFFVAGRTLADLTDVDVVSDPPAQDDVLAWDDTGGKWTPATLSGGADLSNAAPQDLGTAAAGVSTEASRADHVHDMPTAAQVGALPDNTALLALGETSTTAYRGDRGKIAYDHSQITTGNPHGTTAADVGAEPARVVSDVPQSTFIGEPIAPFTGTGATVATAPGTLILSPVAHSWTGVARFWWDITATSATSGQTLHLVVYSPGTGGRPGSLLWSQAFDAATVQQATTTTPASVIPNRGWWGVLFPSTLAGNVTMRFGYPAATTASNFLGGFNNFACSFAATSQGSTPASSLSSYTFGMTPAATVLGASHALRPVCPLIFLRGS